MNIFAHSDYRQILEKVLENLKAQGKRVNHTLLSEAVGVQKTYVSRVLRKQAHFNADQLFLCCQFLNLTLEETNYLNLLLELERSSVKSRRALLNDQIYKIQQEKIKFEHHSKAKMIEPSKPDAFVEYYLDPRAPLVHTFFHIDSFRANPSKIADALGISNFQFQHILKILKAANLIEWNSSKNTFETKVHHLHLKKDSPLSLPAEQLTRVMVIDHLKKLSRDQRFFYSFTFAANESARKFIHEEFLKLIRTTEPVIRSASSEEVFHMSFDLFPWSASK